MEQSAVPQALTFILNFSLTIIITETRCAFDELDAFQLGHR